LSAKKEVKEWQEKFFMKSDGGFSVTRYSWLRAGPAVFFIMRVEKGGRLNE
jgi:hypothetical protein